ncbi:MAG: replication initiator protein A [Lachnospiraceae bacterium]|nr:replication initiator protein A [Lachnospiraceae bacterium]
MEGRPEFKYFYGNEADRYTFYRIPKVLFTSEYFATLSTDAKVLYGLMLDRMSLSTKNQWMDEENRVFIYFSIEDICEMLHCGRNKAIAAMKELDQDQGVGLIEKLRLGQGKETRIYVKNFSGAIEGEQSSLKNKLQENTVSEVPISNFLKFKNQTSRSLKSKLLEVPKSNPSNTEDINNNINISYPINHDSEAIEAETGLMDVMDIISAEKQKLWERLGITMLIKQYPLDQEVIREMAELIFETEHSTAQKLYIAGEEHPAALVKEKFQTLTSDHLEYVLSCMKTNKTKIWNIRKYILTALYNAPATIDLYYRAEVNHDMANASSI